MLKKIVLSVVALGIVALAGCCDKCGEDPCSTCGEPEPCNVCDQ